MVLEKCGIMPELEQLGDYDYPWSIPSGTYDINEPSHILMWNDDFQVILRLNGTVHSRKLHQF